MRRARFDVKGYYYHIICRGQRKNPLFFSPNDRIVFLKILSNLLSEMDLQLFTYCLMTNHIHLLVKRNEHLLHNFMKRLNTNYALYFNNKYNTVGHVFQDRYVSIIVLDESYLGNLIKYIHLNPVRAGITKTPEEYEYSSARFYKDVIPDKFINNLSTPPFLNLMDDFIAFSKTEYGEFPTYKDSIGTEDKYLEFNKRFPGREKGKFIEKREGETEKKNIDNDISSFEIIKNITIDQIRNSRLDKDELLGLVDFLIKKGYSYAEICRAFNKSRAWLTGLLTNLKKRKMSG